MQTLSKLYLSLFTCMCAYTFIYYIHRIVYIVKNNWTVVVTTKSYEVLHTGKVTLFRLIGKKKKEFINKTKVDIKGFRKFQAGMKIFRHRVTQGGVRLKYSDHWQVGISIYYVCFETTLWLEFPSDWGLMQFRNVRCSIGISWRQRQIPDKISGDVKTQFLFSCDFSEFLFPLFYLESR